MTATSTSQSRTFRRFVSDAHATLGWRLPALAGLMLIVALGEGVSMALLLPLLDAVGLAGDNALPEGDLSRLVHLALGDRPSLGVLLGLVLLALSAQAVMTVLQTVWIARAQRQYAAEWQRRLVQGFVSASAHFHLVQGTGPLVHAVTGETFRLSGALATVLRLSTSMALAMVYGALAFSISWPATATLLAMGIIAILPSRLVVRRLSDVGRRVGPHAAELLASIQETLGAIRIVKATGSELRMVARATEHIHSLQRLHATATFLPGLVRTGLEFAAMATLACVLVLGMSWGWASPAGMLLLMALLVRLVPRLNAMQQDLHLLATYLPAFDDLEALITAATIEAEMPTASSGVPGAHDGLSIEIDRAGWGVRTILNQIHLQLPSRGLVAVVGPSGAGKSTLVHAIMGFATIQAGDIRFGAVGLRGSNLAAWRRRLGFVPQDCSLFRGTIRENVAWSWPDAPESEIRRSLRLADAEDFVDALDRGLETPVGELGGRLSGGQRQRLCIARALLRRPSMLLLDEATSSLDTLSEAAILRSLESVRGELCVVLVTHRVASARGADLVVVLENGTVAESGPWADLARQENSALSRLVRASWAG